MLTPLLILILGLTPSLFSLWVIRRSDARTQARLQLALNLLTTRGNFSAFRAMPDLHYMEGVGLMIGDLTCQFNARSSHIRCAINPSGPCAGCSHYAPKEFDDQP